MFTFKRDYIHIPKLYPHVLQPTCFSRRCLNNKKRVKSNSYIHLKKYIIKNKTHTKIKKNQENPHQNTQPTKHPTNNKLKPHCWRRDCPTHQTDTVRLF